MAGTTENEPAPAKHFVDYDEYVDFQIEKARDHIKATEIFTTLTTLVASFVAYLLLFVVFDQWIFEGGFSDWARSALLSVVLLVMGTILVRRVVLPLVRRVHPLYAARMIEKADPNLQSNLLNFVDVRHADGVAPAAGVLRAMEKRAAVELSHIDVDEAIDRRPLLRVAYALLGIVIVSALYIVFSPKDPFTSVRRALLPTAEIAVATETTISDVTPGDDRVPARALLTVEADIRGPDADRAQLLFTTSDNKYVNQPVEMRRVVADLPRFRGALNGENGRGLLQSLSYAIVAGDARTREFRIEVIQPPSARVDEVRYVFPTYMQLPERSTAGGNIDGWEGATVTLNATANMPVKSAAVVMTDGEDPHAKGEEVAMQIADGTRLSAKWKLEFRSDGTFPRYYHLRVKTERGETDPDPTVHTLRIRPDQRPEVALLFPTSDLRKSENAVIPLMYQAVDPDFGLRSITLRGDRNGEEIVNEKLFEEREPTQAFRGSFEWNLAKHNLRPGDEVQFWIEARDNKQPVANRGTTPRLKLEITSEKKSAEQIRQDLAADMRKAEQLADAGMQKNTDGREELPGSERSDDPRADKPPDRPDSVERPRQRPGENPADSARTKQGDKPEPRDATKSGEESGRPQPNPPGDDPHKALERLLQREAAEQENKPPTERPADRQPAEGDRNEDQQNSGDKSKGGSKSGRDKSEEGKSSPKSARGNEPGKEAGDKDQGRNKTQPDGKGADKESDKGSGQKKPGGSKEPGDKQSMKGDSSKEKSSSGASPADEKKEPQSSKEKTGANGSDKDQQKENGAGKSGTKKGEDASKGSGDKDQGEKGSGDREKPDGDKSKTADPSKANPEERRDPDKRDDGKKGQDPASNGAGDDKNPAEEGDADQGKSSKSNSKTGREKPGDASEPQPSSKSKTPGKKSSGDPAEGEEEPADDSPDAKKRQATGNEEGEATGSREDDPDAVKAKKNVQRKSNTDPGMTKKSSSDSSAAKEPGDRRKPDAGTSKSTDDAKNVKRPPDGKKETEQPGKTDDPLSEKPKETPNGDREDRPGQPPDAGNQKQSGDGRKTRQKSEQPETGEKGNSAATDQGQKGGNKEGAGDKSDQPGDSERSTEKTGRPGDDPGKGSTSKSSEKGSKPGAGAGEQKKGGAGKSEDSGEKSTDSSGSGEKGSPGKSESKSSSKEGGGGQSSSKPGEGANKSSGSSGGGIDGPPADKGSPSADGDGEGDQPGRVRTGGEGAPTPEDEEARLEYARKASNLLLTRLQKQLERGEVDQKLLDDMGWRDMNDVARFTKYLEENLKNTGDDASPEALARRLQFEETLKGLRLGSDTERRRGDGSVERRVQPTSVRDMRVPPEYREQYEAYTRNLAKQRAEAEKKAATKSPTKK